MKNTKKILKGASVLLIAAVLILSTLAVTANTNSDNKQVGIFEEVTVSPTLVATNNFYYCNILNAGVFFDSFEDYPDFVVDNFPPWTTIDLDGDGTYGMEGVEWPNAYYTGAYMIFNPSQTTPPIDDTHPAKTGQKYASCWDSVSMPNNDWLISPALTLEEDGMLTFWARSLTDQYGLERMKVGVSTTDMEPSSFDIISPGAYIEVPVAWTQYTFDLSNYTGETVYIAINCVSDDAFSLFIDDFEVTGVLIGDPELACSGSLSWTGVEPGSTVTGSFNVNNIGDAGTVLNWQIDSFPDWGTWTFTPSSGSTTTTTIVNVEVIAPDEQETEFSGSVKVVNSDDPENFCTIDVALATPVNLLTSVNTNVFMSKSVATSQPKPLSSEVIWDNGDDDGTGAGLSSQLDLVYPFNSQVADDFLLTEDADIEGVKWWGVFWNGAGYPATTEFNIMFYDDDGTGNMPTGAGMGDPTSTALAVYNFPSVTGTSVGADRYEYEVTLPTPFSAEAGTKYWIAIQWVGSFSDYGQWGWVTNGDNPDQLHESVSGFPLLGTNYWTDTGYGDMAYILYGEGGEDPIADLDCAGSLNWADVEPGSTVNGTFTVSNVGDAGSLLDWEIQSYPDWGTWTFDPNGGIGLTPEDGAVTVTVEVVAPMDKETEFTGQVVLVNSEDPDDTCTIEVALATPVNYQSPFLAFIQRLIQRFPLLSLLLNLL
ncbi:MAG: choice-of-anchor J domain-containing protein [Thermoplasmatota archaeon]